MANEQRIASYKRSSKSLYSIKQSNKVSVIDRQGKSRDAVITKKRLKLNTIEHDLSNSRSREEENDQIVKAIKDLKKGDKLKALTDLHPLFASHESNADWFLKHNGMQPLHSCFRSLDVEVLHTVAWCVVNLTATASSSYSPMLLGLSPTLMQFLKGSDAVMQELCAWALANLAGDIPSNVNVLHRQGCTDALIDLLQVDYLVNKERTKSVLFALINLARGSATCIQCMHDKDIYRILQALLKGTPVESTLNFELGWFITCIYTEYECWSNLNSVEVLPVMTRLVSDRLNDVVEKSVPAHKDRVCFAFMRCLCNLIGQNPALSRVVLDDLRTYNTINNLLTCGSDGLKQEVLSVINNCMVDVCSRVLLTFQPSIMLAIVSQCHHIEADISTQALLVVHAMVKTSCYVDKYLLQRGNVLPTLIHVLSVAIHRLSNGYGDGVEVEKAKLLKMLKVVVNILLDLLSSQPDMVRKKLEEEETQKLSNSLNALTKLISGDSDLKQAADLLVHNILGQT